MLQSEFPTDAQAVYDDIEKKVFTTIGCSKASFLAKHSSDGHHSSVLVDDDDGDDDRNDGGGSSTRSGSASRAAGIDSLIRQSLSLTSSSSLHNKDTVNKVTHASSTPIQTTRINSSRASVGRDDDHWPMNGVQATASLLHAASRKRSFLDGAGERSDFDEQSNKRGSVNSHNSDAFFDDQPSVPMPSPRLPLATHAKIARDTLLTNTLPTIASTVCRGDTLATTRIPSQPSSSSSSAYSACSSKLGAGASNSAAIALPSKADSRERSSDSRDTDPWFSQQQPSSTAPLAFSHVHATSVDSAGVEKAFEYSVDLDDIFTSHPHDPRSHTTESIYQPHNRYPIAPTSTIIAKPGPTSSLTRAHPYSQPLQSSLPVTDTRKTSFFTQQPRGVHPHATPHHPTSQHSSHHPTSQSFSQWEPTIYPTAPTTTVPFAYDASDFDDIFAPSQHVTRATPTHGQVLLPQNKENFFDSNVPVPQPHTSDAATASMTDPSCTLSGYVRVLPSTVTKRVIMPAAQEEEDW